MKFLPLSKICAVATLCAVAFSPTPGRAILTICNTAQDCLERSCTAGTGWCCPTGRQGEKHSCPSGWSYNAIYDECRRSATSGSDSKGSYTQNYGTCDPDTTYYSCFEYTTSTPSGPYQCMMCPELM